MLRAEPPRGKSACDVAKAWMVYVRRRPCLLASNGGCPGPCIRGRLRVRTPLEHCLFMRRGGEWCPAYHRAGLRRAFRCGGRGRHHDEIESARGVRSQRFAGHRPATPVWVAKRLGACPAAVCRSSTVRRVTCRCCLSFTWRISDTPLRLVVFAKKRTWSGNDVHNIREAGRIGGCLLHVPLAGAQESLGLDPRHPDPDPARRRAGAFPRVVVTACAPEFRERSQRRSGSRTAAPGRW